jgi:osmotically-inducible protein OsmY
MTAGKEITMFSTNPDRPEPETTQFSINELAEKRLHSNPYSALKGVSCDCLDGVLFLRGCLPTYHLKQLAQEVVGGLEGVGRIDNQIRVLTPTPSHQG